MPVLLPLDVLDFDSIIDMVAWDGNCTHPAGHCYGSDGGSGIPENLKVPPGRGGEFEVWQLNKQKTDVLRRLITLRCQYCERYYLSHDKVDVIEEP